MLDSLGALLSGGNATHQITPDSYEETALSQVFLAFDLPSIEKAGMAAQVTNQIIEYVHEAKASGDQKVRYPGERTLEIRQQNLAEGIPVEAHIWQALQDM